MHLVLRSDRAHGSWSLLSRRHKWRVYGLVQKIARRRQVRIYRFANVGNHLHLLVQVKSRAAFQAFLREFSGAVAVIVTGAVKGRPQRFWNGLAWTKIVEWGRQFRNAARYIVLNVLEGLGFRDRAALSRLERDGIVLLGPEPGS